MEKQKSRIKTFIFAVVVVGLLMAFVALTRGIVFETVDEMLPAASFAVR